jgi:hypothetical protein
MKRVEKEVTFLSLVIRHNQEAPRTAKSLANARNNILYAQSDFGEDHENIGLNANIAEY